MANKMREVLNELKEIRIDIKFIKQHMIDATLTLEEESRLNKSLNEECSSYS